MWIYFEKLPKIIRVYSVLSLMWHFNLCQASPLSGLSLTSRWKARVFVKLKSFARCAQRRDVLKGPSALTGVKPPMTFKRMLLICASPGRLNGTEFLGFFALLFAIFLCIFYLNFYFFSLLIVWGHRSWPPADGRHGSCEITGNISYSNRSYKNKTAQDEMKMWKINQEHFAFKLNMFVQFPQKYLCWS